MKKVKTFGEFVNEGENLNETVTPSPSIDRYLQDFTHKFKEVQGNIVAVRDFVDILNKNAIGIMNSDVNIGDIEVESWISNDGFVMVRLLLDVTDKNDKKMDRHTNELKRGLPRGAFDFRESDYMSYSMSDKVSYHFDYQSTFRLPDLDIG